MAKFGILLLFLHRKQFQASYNTETLHQWILAQKAFLQSRGVWKSVLEFFYFGNGCSPTILIILICSITNEFYCSVIKSTNCLHKRFRADYFIFLLVMPKYGGKQYFSAKCACACMHACAFFNLWPPWYILGCHEFSKKLFLTPIICPGLYLYMKQYQQKN